MITKLHLISAFVLAVLIVSFSTNSIMAQGDNGDYTRVKSKGTISSVNPGTSGMGTGEYIWILSGKWRLVADENLNNAKFEAEFDMMNYDGTHRHVMKLNDLKPTSISITEGNVVIEGTLDILGGHSEDEINIIPGGDDVNVIISILEDNVIWIQIDHTHFGGMEHPIYGVVKAIKYA